MRPSDATCATTSEPPPIPARLGWTTLRTKSIAAAASNALPPSARTSSPTLVASGWSLETAPSCSYWTSVSSRRTFWLPSLTCARTSTRWSSARRGSSIRATPPGAATSNRLRVSASPSPSGQILICTFSRLSGALSVWLETSTNRSVAAGRTKASASSEYALVGVGSETPDAAAAGNAATSATASTTCLKSVDMATLSSTAVEERIRVAAHTALIRDQQVGRDAAAPLPDTVSRNVGSRQSLRAGDLGVQKSRLRPISGEGRRDAGGRSPVVRRPLQPSPGARSARPE